MIISKNDYEKLPLHLQNRFTPLINDHNTPKPVDLMSYLIRLVTPKGGKVLDPFNGSGSTGLAALVEQCDYTGIELDQHYCDITTARLEALAEQLKSPKYSLFG